MKKFLLSLALLNSLIMVGFTIQPASASTYNSINLCDGVYQVSDKDGTVSPSMGIQAFTFKYNKKGQAQLDWQYANQTLYYTPKDCYMYSYDNKFLPVSVKTVGKGKSLKNVISIKGKTSSIQILSARMTLCDPIKCSDSALKQVSVPGNLNTLSVDISNVPYQRIVDKKGKVTYLPYKVTTLEVMYADSAVLSNGYPVNPYPDFYNWNAMG